MKFRICIVCDHNSVAPETYQISNYFENIINNRNFNNHIIVGVRKTSAYKFVIEFLKVESASTLEFLDKLKEVIDYIENVDSYSIIEIF